MYLNTIHGWYTGIRWLLSPVGSPIPGCAWEVWGSVLDWGLVLDCLAASAGAGTIGATTGTAADGWSTTTTRTSRIAGRSSIVITFVRRASTIPQIFAAMAVPPAFAGASEACVPAPSAGSIMAVL